MATFDNKINSVGTLIQGDTVNVNQGRDMIIGAPIATTDDLKRQVAELERRLSALPDVPEETRASVAAELREAQQSPADDPAAKDRIVGKLERAKGMLQSVTGIAKEVGPLIGAIGAVVGAASGLVG
jgi:hypothetical protein